VLLQRQLQRQKEISDNQPLVPKPKGLSATPAGLFLFIMDNFMRNTEG
jgi:hypothetical protein